MNGKSMSEKQKKEDYNTVNQKIQERLSRRNKQRESSKATSEKTKQKGVNNEEGD
jgi:hypothetical protein